MSVTLSTEQITSYLDSLPRVTGETQEPVNVRLTRLREHAPEVIYQGPSRLFVQFDNKGKIVVLTPTVMSWAEYGRRDIEDAPRQYAGWALVAEDYLLEFVS